MNSPGVDQSPTWELPFSSLFKGDKAATLGSFVFRRKKMCIVYRYNDMELE